MRPHADTGLFDDGAKLMKLKVLLINPWIYDFAAAKLWAKPLGLLKVAECLSRFDVNIAFIDCMDAGAEKYPKEIIRKPECLRAIPRRYGRYGITTERFRNLLAETGHFDIVFMTSIMSYWYPGVQKAIEVIREVRRDMPVVLGGIYATLWPGHASSCSGADFICKGPVSEEIRFVLATFGYRIEETIKPIPWYRLGLYRGFSFAPVLTGRGCPFRCTYCASGLLSHDFMQNDPADSVDAIRELHTKGTRDFVFYDDALLVNADRHIKVLLREVLRLGIDARFHCPNGLHARFIDEELAGLMKTAGFRTVRLGLETADSERQDATGGKVTSDDLRRAVRLLKKQGFTKKNIGVYLMYGLPGQDFEEVKAGVGLLKSLDVRIHLAEFSPIPGTQAWNDLVNGGIITDDIDPLLTNNTVFTFLYSGYGSQEFEALKQEVKEFNCE
jgi:radical SAM superfamily enzyme YgiQ (UPF0313 family)